MSVRENIKEVYTIRGSVHGLMVYTNKQFTLYMFFFGYIGDIDKIWTFWVFLVFFLYFSTLLSSRTFFWTRPNHSNTSISSKNPPENNSKSAMFSWLHGRHRRKCVLFLLCLGVFGLFSAFLRFRTVFQPVEITHKHQFLPKIT